MTELSKQPMLYEDMADKRYALRLKIHNRELYKYHLEQEKIAHQGHVEYAKWLIASLLAIHGGAIYALNSLRQAVPFGKETFLIYAAAQNLFAIFLTLLAGFFAWLNLQLAEQCYRDYADPKYLYLHEPYAEGNAWIDRWMYTAAICGLLAGCLFLTSSITVVAGLLAIRPTMPTW